MNWTQQYSNSKSDLNAITFTNPLHGWAVGRSGTILYTVNGGKTWRSPIYKRYPAGWYYLICILLLGIVWWLLKSRLIQKNQLETITDLLASDRPLQSGDPDPLGFNEIAQGLSRFLRNPRTEPPLTIAITGEWGTGKSSLMNLLYDDLKHQGFSTVWFNAWHHQKSEQLLATMFANIRRQAIPGWFRFSGFRPVGLLFRLRLLWRRSRRHWFVFLVLVLLLSGLFAYLFNSNWQFSPLLHWLDAQLTTVSRQLKIVFALGATAGTLLPLFVFFKSLQGFALNPLKLMTVQVTEGKQSFSIDPGARYQFAREFQDVTSSLDLGCMIIFIDDLDRCSKEHVLEVLEAINFLVSSGQCYIILGMSREWVQICVGLGFKELATESFSNHNESTELDAVKYRRAFALQYLEKLINIEVPVPVLDETKAIQLTTPDIKQVSLSAFGTISLKVARFLRNNWATGVIISVIALGAYLGWLLKIPDPSQLKYQHSKDIDLSVWPADNLEILTQKDNTILIQKTHESAKNPDQTNKQESLEWVLQGDQEALNKGLLIQEFADGKAKLLLRQAKQAPEVVPDKQPVEVEKPEPESNIEPPKSEPDRSTPGFIPGAKNQATWPKNIPIGLSILFVIAALVLLFRKPDRIVEDSKTFQDALRIWQEWLMMRQQTPRTIKRFLNHLRYMAMRYRDHSEPRNLWQRWLGKTPTPTQSPVFSEPALVALSVLQYLQPQWIIDNDKFQQLNQADLNGLINDLDIESDNSTTPEQIQQLLTATIKKHLDEFQTEQLATDKERQHFLNAISIKPN